MNLQEYKEFLRKEARISDPKWNPTERQLNKIKLEIDRRIQLNQKITVSTLQQIITSIYGSVNCFIFESVDNSDLNELLAQATSNKPKKKNA